MTSLPASHISLMDRGLIRPGMNADITLFDPDIIHQTGTYTDPHRYPKGIEYVLVNGNWLQKKISLQELLPVKLRNKNIKHL